MGEERHLTPAHHLEELLTRCLNPFDVSDAVLDRLRSAVMCRVELRGWRHRNTPRPGLRCGSFRHVFLLADGSSLLLWELCYDSGADGNGAVGGIAGPAGLTTSGGSAEQDAGTELCEVYTSEDSLRRSERRVHHWMGGAEEPRRTAEPDREGCPEETADARPAAEGTDGHGHDDAYGTGPGEEPDPFGDPADPDGRTGIFGALPFDDPFEVPFDDRRFDESLLGHLSSEDPAAEDLAGLDPAAERGGGPARRPFFDFLVTASGPAAGRREYTEHGSADHARRLLRRAENADRPGDETLRLLAAAQGHQILHVPGPLPQTRECHVWCSVYEHAFLLPDGSEVSLYELEHDLGGNGHLVCEVYLEEAGAGRAAHRLARDRGIDL